MRLFSQKVLKCSAFKADTYNFMNSRFYAAIVHNMTYKSACSTPLLVNCIKRYICNLCSYLFLPHGGLHLNAIALLWSVIWSRDIICLHILLHRNFFLFSKICKQIMSLDQMRDPMICEKLRGQKL